MLRSVIAVVGGVAGKNRQTQPLARAAVCASYPSAAAAMLAAVLLLSSACSRGANKSPALATSEPSPEVETITIAPDVPAHADAGGELAGTSWRLVEIASMDDTVDAPADRALYTLSFGADGSMNLLADCNRGTGTWNSASPGQLEFGPIAATQAQCPPGSMHDTYMAQLPWVRSYVFKDGHLFLATMADGSIVEFEREPYPECGEHSFEMVKLPRDVFAIRTDRGISLALAATELASWMPFAWVTLSGPGSRIMFAAMLMTSTSR